MSVEEEIIDFVGRNPRSLKTVTENEGEIILVGDEIRKTLKSVKELKEFLNYFADESFDENGDDVYRIYKHVGSDFASWAREEGIETDLNVNYDFEYLKEIRIRKNCEVVLRDVVYVIKPVFVDFYSIEHEKFFNVRNEG